MIIRNKTGQVLNFLETLMYFIFDKRMIFSHTFEALTIIKETLDSTLVVLSVPSTFYYELS